MSLWLVFLRNVMFMKSIITFFLVLFSVSAFSESRVFEKLNEVNKCWREQKDIDINALPPYSVKSEKEWIRTHLELVEKTLRQRPTEHLNASQLQKRMSMLDALNRYWHEGNFPINDRYAYRTPIFIDPYDNFCAVGYLIKVSGYESVSRMIAGKTNLAYVRQMNYPEVFAWAGEHGFSEDELAWIQPAYPPIRTSAPVGKGTDGEVIELYADNTHGKLYVGGSFKMVDSSLTANNIAYVTESGGTYTWHHMGLGVNGPVHAIAAFDNKIFVGGNFSEAGGNPANSIAYWDGAFWHSAGCLNGTVYDLAVFENELYAAGQFDMCTNLIDVNFARWDGNDWVPYSGVMGIVRTMEVVDNELLLGGQFNYGIAGKNVVKWDKTNGFQQYANGLENGVRDFVKFGDTVYAVCERTSPVDSSLVNKLNGNTWQPEAPYLTSNLVASQAKSFNTLCAHNDTLMMGGDFYLVPMVGNIATHCYSLINPAKNANWFNVDSAINTMAVFKGELIAGGKFAYGAFGWGPGSVRLNGITRKAYSSLTSIGDLQNATLELTVYPNPAAASGEVIVRNNFGSGTLIISDIQGKQIVTYPVSSSKMSVPVSQLAPGSYLFEITNKNGERATQKLMIQ